MKIKHRSLGIVRHNSTGRIISTHFYREEGTIKQFYWPTKASEDRLNRLIQERETQRSVRHEHSTYYNYDFSPCIRWMDKRTVRIHKYGDGIHVHIDVEFGTALSPHGKEFYDISWSSALRIEQVVRKMKVADLQLDGSGVVLRLEEI